MITIGYSIIALLAAACLVFAARAYLNEPNKMLLLILCPTSLLWFDSFVIAMESLIVVSMPHLVPLEDRERYKESSCCSRP